MPPPLVASASLNLMSRPKYPPPPLSRPFWRQSPSSSSLHPAACGGLANLGACVGARLRVVASAFSILGRSSVIVASVQSFPSVCAACGGQRPDSEESARLMSPRILPRRPHLCYRLGVQRGGCSCETEAAPIVWVSAGAMATSTAIAQHAGCLDCFLGVVLLAIAPLMCRPEAAYIPETGPALLSHLLPTSARFGLTCQALPIF